ncbi:hypothetical protein C0Z18_27825 [Trinickia dabaoshanensis]|uniref:Uncharacterized protein n=1 Tax=Trinickia dabaoshanensis TaxID=564714 RepID=A0A2N7VDR5_9BURK|nr:hypothetical protein C0Z18_27825 [Trinickia dabaoshanensis]
MVLRQNGCEMRVHSTPHARFQCCKGHAANRGNVAAESLERALRLSCMRHAQRFSASSPAP